MTTKIKIIGGFTLMVLLLMVASGLGYTNLDSATKGMQTTKRLATFNAATSNLTTYINASTTSLFQFMDNPHGEFMTEAKQMLEKAQKEIANCEAVVVKAERRNTLKDLRQTVIDGGRLEDKIQSGVKEGLALYNDKVRPTALELSKNFERMSTAAAAAGNVEVLSGLVTSSNILAATRARMATFSVNRSPEDAKQSLAYLKELEVSLKAMDKAIKLDTVRAALGDCLRSYDTMYASMLTMQTKYAEVNQDLISAQKLFGGLAKTAEKLSGDVDAESNSVSAQLDEETAAASRQTIIIGSGGLILGIAAALFIVSGILRVLNELSIFADSVSRGNFNAVAKVSEKGEIGTMVTALQNIPAVLKEIIATYAAIEKNIEDGMLDTQGDFSKFSGEFATLIKGTNNVLSRFRLVIDNIPSPVMTMTKDLRLIFMNRAGVTLSGDNYKNQSVHGIFKADDQGTSTDALQKAISTQSTASGETRLHPRNTTIDVTYSSIPMTDVQGKLTCVLQLVTDISQIKQTQRTIMEVAAQALDISNRVAAASEQLSSQVEQVSRGTDTQRDRAASTATAMEEMNATVLEVARSAGQASDQAEATRNKAQYGADMVNKVISAIHQVNTVASELQGNMQELGAQAEAIGGVMNVISDIADQTNLLALNAAIEAARAGEAGRGFAVVADEVRKLAEKTMGATTEVGSSIRGIQTSAANNISRVTNAAKNVGEATELAGTSGTALQEILQLAANNSSLIASIATAAEEQSTTSEEINSSIDEVNRIAGETAQGMMQSASAVQELSHMAQELKVLLDKLRSN